MTALGRKHEHPEPRRPHAPITEDSLTAARWLNRLIGLAVVAVVAAATSAAWLPAVLLWARTEGLA
jgi:hypothetical protein